MLIGILGFIAGGLMVYGGMSLTSMIGVFIIMGVTAFESEKKTNDLS